MELTGTIKEEEIRMTKNEKRIIISLAMAIVVAAIALIAMMITSGNSGSGQTESLKDAVQQESNSNGSDDVSESNAGESVSEEDAGESGDNMTTEQPTTEEPTTEEATTAAAKNNTASSVMDADDGYIFPDVDTSYVSKSSVKKLSDEELQYAVNEVYARHGLKFTKKQNKERFEKKEWYVGTVDDQDEISLNKYEKKNVDTMAAELKKRGLR